MSPTALSSRLLVRDICPRRLQSPQTHHSAPSDPSSALSKLLNQCTPLKPDGRALAIESSKEIEFFYHEAATADRYNDSEVPDDPEEEVDFHYIAFVKSSGNGHVYQMDGDCKGPIDLGGIVPEGEDMLGESMLKVVKGFMKEDPDNLHFHLIALCSDGPIA